MTSGLSSDVDVRDLVVVGVLSLVAVAVVALVVRALAPRRGWTSDAAAALTWSWAPALVSALSLLWIAPWRPPTSRQPLELGEAEVVVAAGDRVFTLVWLPCVMALLWWVLHVLRSGTGHPAPLSGVPLVLAVPALWLVTAPLQITVFTVGIVGLLTWVGLVVWGVGQALVALGRTWFGDVAVWAGIALVAADAWPGYLGLVSPVVVAALVVRQLRRTAAGTQLS